jgi:hypothetical protein
MKTNDFGHGILLSIPIGPDVRQLFSIEAPVASSHTPSRQYDAQRLDGQPLQKNPIKDLKNCCASKLS